MKNIRNNQITEKNKELKYEIDGETKVAKFSDLEQLYKLECYKTVKLSKLTEVAVYPKPVERQKVSTCLQIFNEKIITALMTHPELTGAADTEKFISLILEFWNIVSVHNAGLDLRTLNPVRSVIRTREDTNLNKLSQMADHICILVTI